MKRGRHGAGQLRVRAVGAETHGALRKDHAVLTGRGQGRQLRRLPRSPPSSPYRTKACSPRGRSRKHRWRRRLEGEAGAAETLCLSLVRRHTPAETSYFWERRDPEKAPPRGAGTQGLRSKPSSREPLCLHPGAPA